MFWVWILLAAALTWGGIVCIGRLPKTARPLAGAAIMLGIAGYALQGSPALPGHPVAKEGAPESFGEALTDTRQGMADRFGPAAQWLAMSDGFARTGQRSEESPVGKEWVRMIRSRLSPSLYNNKNKNNS